MTCHLHLLNISEEKRLCVEQLHSLIIISSSSVVVAVQRSKFFSAYSFIITGSSRDVSLFDTHFSSRVEKWEIETRKFTQVIIHIHDYPHVECYWQFCAMMTSSARATVIDSFFSREIQFQRMSRNL